MKVVTMTINVAVEDKDQLIDFATKLYDETWHGDMEEDMELYDDKNKKIVRSIFEVLIGSAPLPYQYADAGIAISDFRDESVVNYDF